jgi:preprotein translocase subunit SecF
MTFIGLRAYWYGLSGVLVMVSITMLLIFGLDLGIDFTGGSLIELSFTEQVPSSELLQNTLASAGVESAVIQQTGENGVLIRTRDLDEATHQQVLAAIRSTEGEFLEKQFVSIGPVIGGELKKKAVSALIFVGVMIVLYIAWAFRHVSKPIASWKFGLVAIVALLHDVLIPAGLFSYFGAVQGIEVGALFVTALLTVLGFSVHDTIVVFDRVRENLQRLKNVPFEEVVERSVQENIIRSLNTSLTLLFVLSTLFIFGSESTRYFALALAVGTIAGTYSSLFLASPLLVTWERWIARKSS